MKLLHRIGYYLGGFSIGLIVLAFFLSGKKTSCDYGPNSRVLKNIRIKERIVSDEILSTLNSNSLDTSDISVLMKYGKVNFSQSNTKLDSCKIYVIEGELKNKEASITVENCEMHVKIKDFTIAK